MVEPMIPTWIDSIVERLRPAMDIWYALLDRAQPVFAPAGRVWLRFERRLPPTAPVLLVRAFAISLAAHLTFFTTIELGIRLGLLDRSMFPILLLAERTRPKSDPNSPDRKTIPPELQEIPVVFVDVDPAKASKEAPKDTKYYSSKNSVASSTDAAVESDKPKISGKQDEIAATRTVARTEPAPKPIVPEPAPKPVKEEAQPLQRANPNAPKPENVAMVKATENPDPPKESTTIKPEPALARPRTLDEASRQARLVQEPMKQDGGGKKKSSGSESLDVAAMPFGEYDERVIAAIEQNWYDLLDEQKVSRSHIGKVIVTFRLNPDGRVTQVNTSVNEVGAIMGALCNRAVINAAGKEGFGAWPSDMRRMVNAEFRLVRFTFHYN